MILTQIDKTNRLYSLHSQAALQDSRIISLLDKYKRAILHTKSLFQKTKVIETCSSCARKNRGSCCFKGMEDNYDSILLFVNLLLGVELPTRREVEEHCFFVGSAGCKLVARYYFCVHYFCPSLEKALGQEKMDHLLRVVGREILAGWELELAIRNFLSEVDKK